MTDGVYKSVEALKRGLNILKALNSRGQGATASELAAATGIHRTTVKRLLETLLHEGFVEFRASDECYWLARGVRDLSDGYRDEHWVSEIAAPHMTTLLQDVPWPADLTTLDGDAMIIRETTHRFSRLSFHRSMVGRRLPLLLTAAGRVYLAHCPDAERESLQRVICSQYQDIPESVVASQIAETVRRVRRLGYSENDGEWAPEQRFAAIAVPVFGANRLQAALSIVFPSSAMKAAEAAEKFLKNLQQCAEAIHTELDASRD